ncbi:MAG: hypothetical protein PHY26_00960 [Bacilli bacterium]|nr:hypothetical protein [Bacilli bacterium]
MNNIEKDFITRHSIKPSANDPESTLYPGISKNGVKLAQKRATDILKILEEAPANTIMFIGGCSDIKRTKTTAMIYGEEIKKIITTQKKEDILFFLLNDMQGKGFTAKKDYLIKQINNNPNKKIIITLPLMLKELSFIGDFTDINHQFNEYTQALLKQSKGNETEALRLWFANQGEIHNIKGPNPKIIAEKQLNGLKRLRTFINTKINNRPIIIAGIGHAWSLDALKVYLINNGQITKKDFKETLNEKMVKETEIIEINKKSN